MQVEARLYGPSQPRDAQFLVIAKAPMASREYLRCLLSLTSGALQSVLAGKPKSYYSGLLSSIGAWEAIPQSDVDCGDVQLDSLRAEHDRAGAAGKAEDSESDSGKDFASWWFQYIYTMRESISRIASAVQLAGGRALALYVFVRYDESPMCPL